MKTSSNGIIMRHHGVGSASAAGLRSNNSNNDRKSRWGESNKKSDPRDLDRDDDGSNVIDSLRRLQQHAFKDIMELRHRLTVTEKDTNALVAWKKSFPEISLDASDEIGLCWSVTRNASTEQNNNSQSLAPQEEEESKQFAHDDDTSDSNIVRFG